MKFSARFSLPNADFAPVLIAPRSVQERHTANSNLKGEYVDWTSSTVSFTRQKSGVPVIVNLGAEALNLFKDLPAEGVLFP